MVKRRNLLMNQTGTVARRRALFNMGMAPVPTRPNPHKKKLGAPNSMPTKYHNKKRRQIFLTLSGKYVLRQNGKSLYGRKAAGDHAASAPPSIRPKRIPK